MNTVPVLIYVHRNNDEYFPWELDHDGTERFDHEVHNRIHYMAYEVELLYMLDTDTGISELIAAREGSKWLTQAGYEVTDELLRRAKANT